jgi:hypothetical protein
MREIAMTRTRTLTLTLTLFALALVAGSRTASADAIMGPPDDCAPGAIGRSSHAGQWCTPTTCNEDADCAALSDRQAIYGGPVNVYTCGAIDLCVRTETYQPGGRGAFLRGPDEPLPTREIATSCTPGCEAPGTCTHVKRCVRLGAIAPQPRPPVAPPVANPPPALPTPAPPAAPPAAASGGLCAISAGQATGPALVLLGALALLALRRARRVTRRLPPR